jgi:hypothetical protein
MTTISMITQLMTTDSGICIGPTLTYSTVSSSIRALVRLLNLFFLLPEEWDFGGKVPCRCAAQRPSYRSKKGAAL